MGNDDQQDIKAPVVEKWLVIFIATFGLASFAFTIVAEITRTKSYDYLLDAENILHCVYPTSPASWWAVAAIGGLVIAQSFTFLFGGFAWVRSFTPRYYETSNARNLVIIVLIANMMFLATALSLLITAAVENEYHTKQTLYGYGQLHCSLVEQGVFLSASAVTFFTVVLMEAYYLLSVKACQEAWVKSYNTPPVVDMEAFTRETSRTSVTSIVSRDSQSITNTPVDLREVKLG